MNLQISNRFQERSFGLLSKTFVFRFSRLICIAVVLNDSADTSIFTDGTCSNFLACSNFEKQINDKYKGYVRFLY